ncbi:ArsR/SmtB family transcription factor [Streptomyces caeni]|uniref:ArsR/SmtB family transcription factor n=1 Tax=Streptomyces caeni TaxID=2307231 RepID=A0ABW4J1Z9_9ACTN
MDQVFKALADTTRRRLLDRLRERGGQTLGELCERFDMTRQSVTQHLAVLEAANLVKTVRRGREKLHYLNPVPLQEMQERWIDKFERPRPWGSPRSGEAESGGAPGAKRRAEEAMTDRPTFVYVIYIESTPEAVWDALTDPDLTAAYWGHGNVSDWKPGSRWEHVRTDGSGIADVVGTVLESERPTRLVTTWTAPEDEGREDKCSKVTFGVRPHADIVRLTVTHEDLADETERTDAARGWAAVLSNLKSLIETGTPLPQEPWLVPNR